MTNPTLQDFKNHLAAEIPPAQRVYAFKDLPTNVQQNLLRLQNADGDFLRYSNNLTCARGGVLFLLSIFNQMKMGVSKNMNQLEVKNKTANLLPPVLAGLIFIPVVF